MREYVLLLLLGLVVVAVEGDAKDEKRGPVDARESFETTLNDGLDDHFEHNDNEATVLDALLSDESSASTLGLKVLSSPIRFEPRHVDFEEQPMGMPVVREVRVLNVNEESSIEMLSISGNGIHFHCSFFADKVIPPSGNTSFEVVFLGREEGLVENTLYIHTSAGSFRLLVRAKATANPYRLKPLVGLKIPLNASYSPVIEMHNPHDEPIQIVEMYSSGGDLHLELPSGDTDGPQGVWLIPAYQTKPIMRATFLAREENNHTAYIRIKTNTTSSDFLYLPLEVEVSSQPNLYSHQEALDFGLLSSSDRKKTLRVLISNSASRPITIQSVVVTPNSTVINEAISVVFEQVKIPPRTLEPVEVAQIVLDPSVVAESGLLEGCLHFQSINSQYSLTVDFRADILKGGLSVDEQQMQFHLPSLSYNKTLTRSINVENTFDSSLVIHGIDICKDSMINFTSNYSSSLLLLRPGEKRLLASISLKERVNEVGAEEIVVRTNVSDIRLPVVVYHGFLTAYAERESDVRLIDAGLFGLNAARSILLALINPNPLAVKLKKWSLNLRDSSIELLGGGLGSFGDVKARDNLTSDLNVDISRNDQVLANGFVVFKLNIFSRDREEDIIGKLVVETDFEVLSIDIRAQVARGQLQSLPHQVTFSPAFPGSVGIVPLMISSSFSEDMLLESVLISPKEDTRFYFVANESRIEAGKTSLLGSIHFEPDINCHYDNSCYTGFDIDSDLGSTWLDGLKADYKTIKSDLEMAKERNERFLTSLSLNTSISVTVNTDRVKAFDIEAQATLVMPTVVDSGKSTWNGSHRFHFGLTQVGNASSLQIELHNPSTAHPVFFHIVPATEVQGAANLDLASFRRSGSSLTRDATRDSNPFELVSVSGLSSALQTFVDLIDEDESSIPPLSKLFVVQPDQRARIHLRFKPESAGVWRQTLFVRNNLTSIEVIELMAEGTLGDLQFGVWNAAFGGQAVINFEVADKHLRDCTDETQRNRFSPPLVTVKRSFRLKNLGRTSVYIRRFRFEQYKCEGHGFKVLNCNPFSLRPNEWRDIDIAFTPDFTLSQLRRSFSIESTLGKPNDVLNLTIEATVPHHMLSQCFDALPRPTWEAPIYYSVNIVMGLLLIIVLLAAFFESSRIARSSILYLTNAHVDKGHLLDLRKVQNEAMEELRLRITQKKHGDQQQKTTETPLKKGQPKQKKTNHVNNVSNKRGSKSRVEETRGERSQSRRDSRNVSKDTKWSRTMAWITNKAIVPLSSLAAESGRSGKSSQNDLNDMATEVDNNSSLINNSDSSGKASKSSEPATPETPMTPVALSKKSKKKQLAKTQSKPQNETDKLNNNVCNKGHEETNSESMDNRTPSHCDSQSNMEETEDEVSCLWPSAENNNVFLGMTSAQKGNISKTKSRSKKRNQKKESNDEERRRETESKVFKKKKEEESKKKDVINSVNQDNNKNRQTPKLNENKNLTPNTKLPEEPKQSLLPPSSFASKSEQKSSVKAPPPVGKILPEPKRPENLGAHFGPIGAKVPQQRPLSSWNDSPARAQPFSPPVESVFAANFEKKTPQSSGSAGFTPTHAPLGASASLGLISGGSPTRSLMQTLQDERRQRTQEYLRNTRNTRNWPGFDQTPADYFANLWDQPQPAVPAAPAWGSAWPSWSAEPERVSDEAEKSENNGGFGNGTSFNPLASSLWDRQPLVKNENDDAAGTWSAALFNNKK